MNAFACTYPQIALPYAEWDEWKFAYFTTFPYLTPHSCMPWVSFSGQKLLYDEAPDFKKGLSQIISSHIAESNIRISLLHFVYTSYIRSRMFNTQKVRIMEFPIEISMLIFAGKNSFADVHTLLAFICISLDYVRISLFFACLPPFLNMWITICLEIPDRYVHIDFIIMRKKNLPWEFLKSVSHIK